MLQAIKINQAGRSALFEVNDTVSIEEYEGDYFINNSDGEDSILDEKSFHENFRFVKTERAGNFAEVERIVNGEAS